MSVCVCVCVCECVKVCVYKNGESVCNKKIKRGCVCVCV